MKKVLITGANGFVGSHLVDYLLGKGYKLTASVRKLDPSLDLESENIHWVQTGEISPETDWREIVNGIDVIIHLAQRAHVMRETEVNPEEVFHKMNVEVLESLVKQAIAAKVKKFIFLSSIKVNGERTTTEPFQEKDQPNPEDAYGRSKLNAELLLWRMTEKTSMKVTVVRPPLVYGARSPGNFKSLIQLVKSGLPLPFGAINNKRSLVGVNNLCDFLETCIRKKEANNETFLVSDDSDYSTSELIRQIKTILGIKFSFNLPFPSKVIQLLLMLIGKQKIADRLLGSLQIDISKAKKILNWKPPHHPEYDFKNAIGFPK